MIPPLFHYSPVVSHAVRNLTAELESLTLDLSVDDSESPSTVGHCEKSIEETSLNGRQNSQQSASRNKTDEDDVFTNEEGGRESVATVRGSASRERISRRDHGTFRAKSSRPERNFAKNNSSPPTPMRLDASSDQQPTSSSSSSSGLCPQTFTSAYSSIFVRSPTDGVPINVGFRPSISSAPLSPLATSSSSFFYDEGKDDDNDVENGVGGDAGSVPSREERQKFRSSLHSSATMLFHKRSGLPLNSSPVRLTPLLFIKYYVIVFKLSLLTCTHEYSSRTQERFNQLLLSPAFRLLCEEAPRHRVLTTTAL